MKAIIFTTMLAGLAAGAFAQTPEKKSVALVSKQTGTWCVNCGTWGWPLGHDLFESTRTSGKGIYIAVYNNAGPSYGSPDLANTAGSAFDANFNTSGVPNFYVNGIGDPANTSQPGWTSFTDENVALAAVNAFAATVPTVSSAANYSISGNTITSTAKAQYWSDVTGEYYMGSYIVEDSVMAPQYPLSSTANQVHVGVLRASMTGTGFWGEQIGTGSITANTTATKTYSATLDASWNKSHLRVFTVIWKKNSGGKYEFVNSALSKSGGTGISELVESSMIRLFPNPATDNVSIALEARKASDLEVSIVDVTGRTVVAPRSFAVIQGSNQMNISTKGLANGTYHVVLASGNSRVSQQLSIVR